jgi:hypothetical protein
MKSYELRWMTRDNFTTTTTLRSARIVHSFESQHDTTHKKRPQFIQQTCKSHCHELNPTNHANNCDELRDLKDATAMNVATSQKAIAMNSANPEAIAMFSSSHNSDHDAALAMSCKLQ